MHVCMYCVVYHVFMYVCMYAFVHVMCVCHLFTYACKYVMYVSNVCSVVWCDVMSCVCMYICMYM